MKLCLFNKIVKNEYEDIIKHTIKTAIKTNTSSGFERHQMIENWRFFEVSSAIVTTSGVAKVHGTEICRLIQRRSTYSKEQ